jgi:hypothetical protein
MENERSTQFENVSARTETDADKEWSELQRDLDVLGRQLAELQNHTAQLGAHLVSSLEARFQEVKSRAESFRRARERELEQTRQAAWRQAESTFREARIRSTEAARQMWERAEPLRQGAKDVGAGLVRAWGELRASFGKAASRLHTESPSAQSNGAVTVASEDRRETS